MKKILLLLAFSLVSLNAGLINAISVLVNEEPITLIDIDNKMTLDKVNKQTAVNILIEEILYNQSLDKLNVSVDSFDVNNYMEQLASQNKMKVFEFKNAVRRQQSLESFQSDIKKRLIHQKLIAKIAQNNIAVATDEDMKIYFNNNQYEFNLPRKIDVRVYLSKNKKILSSMQNNPMMNSNEITIQNVTLESSQLNPKIKYIISKTANNNFSSIFVNNKTYNMFYVIKKYDIQTITFAEAKNKIFETIMKQRQDEYLKNYFETLKITAKIKVLE